MIGNNELTNPENEKLQEDIWISNIPLSPFYYQWPLLLTWFNFNLSMDK